MNDYLIRLKYFGETVTVSAENDAQALQIAGDMAVGPVLPPGNIHAGQYGFEPFISTVLPQSEKGLV